MNIQGYPVRDYAYLWIKGGCPLHQWASGAIGITREVCDHVAALLGQAEHPADREGLAQLLRYLLDNYGSPARPYRPGRIIDVTA